MSAKLTNTKILVLNKNWVPMKTVTLRYALTMLIGSYDNGERKARIIDPVTLQPMTWEDWAELRPLATDDQIAGANMSFKVPEIILLSHYEKVKKPQAKFNRRTLLKRDEMRCQYCGKKCEGDEWSVDHVKPKSQGGPSTWENCVVCCVKCNRRKANRTPQEANMPLLKEPKKPKTDLCQFDISKPIKSWEQFLGEAYHLVEMPNENK